MAYTRRYSWDGGTVQGWVKHYGTPTVALAVAAVSSAGSAGSLRVSLSAVPTTGYVNAAVYDAGQALGGALAGGNLRAVVRQETGGAGWSCKLYWQDKTASYVVHATPGMALTQGTWVDYAALPDAAVPVDNTLNNGFGVEFFNGGPATATASFSIDFYEQGTPVTNNPVPTAAELVPSLALATGAAFTLQVFGSGFVSGSVVRWGGADRTTTYVSATELRASIPATDIGTAATPSVTVFNPTPGGGLSGALTFTVRAAPSAARWYANGAQPTGISQVDALNALRLQYDWWRHYALTQAGMPAGMPSGAWRVKVPDQNDPTTGRPNGTFSEGIGYGLLIMGWMGDTANPVYDPGARAYADGLWTYYRFFRDTNGLMNWRIDDLGNVTGTGGATDGDHDSAFGLLLAHRNWGSAGAVNYLAEGTALINAIDSTEFTPATDPAPHVMTNGDQWGFAADRYMPDYFAPGFYRFFGQVVSGSRWPTLIATNYPKAQGYFMTTFTAGMVPDECDRAGATVAGTSYKYGYNAIRFPFRVSLDYLWNGAGTNALAKSAPLRLANFHRDPARANGIPANSRAEWAIDGSASAAYTNLAFVSGYGVAGTVDATTAAWAGACAAYLRDNARDSSYFGTCLSTLGLLVLAGQAQPYSAASAPVGAILAATATAQATGTANSLALTAALAATATAQATGTATRLTQTQPLAGTGTGQATGTANGLTQSQPLAATGAGVASGTATFGAVGATLAATGAASATGTANGLTQSQPLAATGAGSGGGMANLTIVATPGASIVPLPVMPGLATGGNAVDTTLGGLTVVDPDGIEHDLSGGNPLYVLLGLEGLHMPPVDLLAENVPRQPGGRLREVRFTAREIDLPLRLVAATPAALAVAVRRLLGWFNPTRAASPLLRFTAPDGTQREIAARYVKGLDFNDDLGAWRTDRRTTLVLRAYDPYWYDRNERTGGYALGAAQGRFFPLPPLRLASSTVFAGPTIANDGDVEAWPVWTLAGPGVNPTLRNLTTGKMLALTGTLLAGQTLTIDTRPRTERAPYGKTLRLQDGTNWLPNLAPGSALWPLARGGNAVQIELTGATSQSGVSYAVRPPFLSI